MCVFVQTLFDWWESQTWTLLLHMIIHTYNIFLRYGYGNICKWYVGVDPTHIPDLLLRACLFGWYILLVLRLDDVDVNVDGCPLRSSPCMHHHDPLWCPPFNFFILFFFSLSNIYHPLGFSFTLKLTVFVNINLISLF